MELAQIIVLRLSYPEKKEWKVRWREGRICIISIYVEYLFVVHIMICCLDKTLIEGYEMDLPCIMYCVIWVWPEHM